MEKKKSIRINSLNDITPIVTFLLIAVFFGVATKGKIYSPYNLKILFDQSITTIVAGLGMIFVIAMGGTDITTGAVVALSGYASYLLGCRYGVIVAFVAAILVGTFSGLVMGIVNAKYKVPSFMASLAVGAIALRGIVAVITSKKKTEVIATKEFLSINEMPIKLPIVLVLLVLAIYVFHYTKFGYYCRAIGENEVAVKYAGINVTKIKMIAFIISGIMGGIAGVFTVSRAGGIQSTLGTGFEMNVMMAVFVAGVPVSGGMGTKIYKLILGAFTLLILQTGMVLCGLSGSIIQGVRGIILIGVVYLSVALNKYGSSGIELKLPSLSKKSA